ncbi:serine O-acetyltransferase, partial [Bellilinea sp.]
MFNWIRTMQNDIRSALERDPAARNGLEIILAYPGIHALWLHRIAHFL